MSRAISTRAAYPEMASAREGPVAAAAGGAAFCCLEARVQMSAMAMPARPAPVDPRRQISNRTSAYWLRAMAAPMSRTAGSARFTADQPP